MKYIYYDLIKSLFTPEEFELLIEKKTIPWKWEEVDISEGSGFHARERKRKRK